jgi:hypothetical protein
MHYMQQNDVQAALLRYPVNKLTHKSGNRGTTSQTIAIRLVILSIAGAITVCGYAALFAVLFDFDLTLRLFGACAIPGAVVGAFCAIVLPLRHSKAARVAARKPEEQIGSKRAPLGATVSARSALQPQAPSQK